MTMGTHDLSLLALDLEGRVDEAEDVWYRLLETHSCSISGQLFSRMIFLYEHHHLMAKILEVIESHLYILLFLYLSLTHLMCQSTTLLPSPISV